MSDKFRLSFINRSGPARCAPNPQFPNGIEVDMSGGKPSCTTALPYPAEECGTWVIDCTTCGMQVMVSAAGRADDPNSVRVPCKLAVFRQ